MQALVGIFITSFHSGSFPPIVKLLASQSSSILINLKIDRFQTLAELIDEKENNFGKKYFTESCKSHLINNTQGENAQGDAGMINASEGNDDNS